ncbi:MULTISPECIES: GH25 family lysozyme [Streptomyces]|uniref:GH25 family lysozyme n=1 Tax=Streptomyces TaxID=1883 RepID=UPI00163BF845|nr:MULTISPECIES: GH25 family lysozyme [Streptomyces]MBC2875498.1 peptidoglycan-binding protein [Streptomyces sp. TYQ1024]UBI35737.1 peptidoglycan-binding protein [Streptomyces mobaraensis]UKW28330.1 peptidoglycan-binding protein [Streptomyces sp. TYQ1024]
MTSPLRPLPAAGLLAPVLLALLAPPAVARAEDPVPPVTGGEERHHAGSSLPEPQLRPAPPARTAVRGLDVSAYQGDVDWPAAVAAGASFAYVKATEGLTYRNAFFTRQYDGAADAGLVRGAYHFARPDSSDGAAQADAFLAAGGGWRADGRTLPGALDIEGYPDAGVPACYGLDPAAMTAWIHAFADRYRERTGRYPALYTNVSWWARCTGGSRDFGATLPLWVANHNGTAHPLPAGWSTYAIWQTADRGPFPGDQDVFNGSLQDLRSFADGTYTPPPTAGWPLLAQGQRGPQVTAAQYLLNARGASLDPDGAFGPATRDAVTAFQRSAGLAADGIIGPNTWQALIQTVRTGSTGPAVQAAQHLLVAHGSALDVDGVFGTGTRDAVAAYQTAWHLDADGVVGPATWQALLS